MKHFLLSMILCFLGNIALGQNSPKEISPEILKKIKAEVETQVPTLKLKLSKQELNADEIEFKIDTFRIETIASKRIEIDYSTTGMNISVDEMTIAYDKLMNKYYNKLMKLLKPEDKKVLITAQKAWLVFRDAELNLIGTMTDDDYSGGGTIQSNIRVGLYSSLVVERTIEIFNYYNGIIKNE
ncbi:lysozyme inhibitor LprI family protein [Flavobacterium sp. HNIBRBA15423]|uniref:lysozyme inhibitor LprI family protein n=1 Tax=Flavobacterium sp. HNIBRBA15423 TaxID=3458683 RepID=UPI004043D542